MEVPTVKSQSVRRCPCGIWLGAPGRLCGMHHEPCDAVQCVCGQQLHWLQRLRRQVGHPGYTTRWALQKVFALAHTTHYPTLPKPPRQQELLQYCTTCCWSCEVGETHPFHNPICIACAPTGSRSAVVGLACAPVSSSAQGAMPTCSGL